MALLSQCREAVVTQGVVTRDIEQGRREGCTEVAVSALRQYAEDPALSLGSECKRITNFLDQKCREQPRDCKRNVFWGGGSPRFLQREAACVFSTSQFFPDHFRMG
jgi:hypothetical protein